MLKLIGLVTIIFIGYGLYSGIINTKGEEISINKKEVLNVSNAIKEKTTSLYKEKIEDKLQKISVNP